MTRIQIIVQDLTSDIPHIQLETIVHEGLDIEALGRHNLGDILVGQLLEDGGLSGVVETQHQKTSLLVGLQKSRKESENKLVSLFCL